MLEFLQNFHFLRPWILLFLIFVIILYQKKLRLLQQTSTWEDICDKNLLNFLLVKNSSMKKVNLKKFVFLGLLAGIFGAAGPSFKKSEVPTFIIENPNMFVLSLAHDMQLRDITPSRLDRAKFLISDIIQNISQGQFGLIVYSREPYVITPITDDKNLIKNLLPQITLDIVPDNGDRLDRAIDLAVQRFSEANYSRGNIVLLTSDIGQRFDLAVEKVKEAQKNNFNVSVIDTSYEGNEKLKLLSDYGDGVYLNIKSSNFKKIINHMNQFYENQTLLSQNLGSSDVDYGYYFVFIALFCLLMFFRKGLLLVFLFLPSICYAGFFYNDNQEGFKLFNKEKYEEAFMKFTDYNWKGLSLYKQSKLEDALKIFEKINSADGFYNKGVTLAKLCHYDEAIQAFNEVLKIDPQNEDALYNKSIILELLEKAKDDKSLLDCNNEQQNQPQNQDKNQQQEQQENQQNQNENQQQEQQQNGKQNQDENQQQQQDNSKDNSSQSNEDSKSQQENRQDDSSQQNPQNDKNNDNEQSKDNKKDSQQNENTDKKDSKDQPSRDENDSKQDSSSETSQKKTDENSENNNQNDTNGSNSENKQQNTEMQSMGVNEKKPDNNEEYNEEALAMQRRYRNIPEDVGGLLREFIKKEYLKGRYNE